MSGLALVYCRCADCFDAKTISGSRRRGVFYMGGIAGKVADHDVLLESMTDDESGGKRLGPCVLWTRIGSGGMGTVYIGDHERWGRDLAIKVLPVTLRLSDPDYDTRFYREAKAAQSIKDHRIVRVYEVGEASPHLYMVMEFVGGGTLRRRIEKSGGKLDVADTLPIIREVARGLRSAHERGVLHRDIKPDNIMFTNGGDVKIADFGLAKVIDSGTKMTQSLAGIGTPRYMAPEQCEDAGHVDVRADIYALGVVMYECLAGVPPFDGDTPSAILFKVSKGHYKKLRERDIGVPGLVSDYVDELIALDPNDRPGSADDVVRDLSDLITGPGAGDRERTDVQRVVRPRHDTPRRPAGYGRPIPPSDSGLTHDGDTPASRSESREPTGIRTPVSIRERAGSPVNPLVASIRAFFSDSPDDDAFSKKGKIAMVGLLVFVAIMMALACLGILTSALSS